MLLPFLFGTREAAPTGPVVTGPFLDRRERPAGDHQGESAGVAAGSHPD